LAARSRVPLFILGWCLAASAAAETGHVTPVTATTATERAIEQVVNLTGTITAARSARLSTATSGLVSAIHVDAGSQVAAGELLLELDPELAELQLASANAQVEQASTALKDAARRLEEARQLIPQRSIAESVVRDREAEVAGDEAALHRTQSDAAYRQGILARHQLRAPFAGVVSAKLTELGEWIDPGEPVFELVGTDEVRIDFEVAEDFLGQVKPQTPVSYRLNADPERVYEGRVATVVPVTDPGARTFLLRVSADSGARQLLPGMSVLARLTLPAGRRGTAVPRDAILRFPDGRQVVWVVEHNDGIDTVHERPVTTGLAFDSLVEIREGLESGARVVVEGNETLQDGQSVQVLENGPGE